MDNAEMARSYLVQAEERLIHAREAVERGNYAYTVRQCQEAVELSLKAALRIVGIEVPKWHDVGPILRKESERFPEWFRKEIPRMARVSRRLYRERGPSMYGDEMAGIPPNMLYDEVDAREALEMATEVFNSVVKLYKEAFGAPPTKP